MNIPENNESLDTYKELYTFKFTDYPFQYLGDL
jgi:hypothetical protein